MKHVLDDTFRVTEFSFYFIHEITTMQYNYQFYLFILYYGFFFIINNYNIN